MQMLVLTADQLPEVEALNAASPVHKLGPVALEDGRYGLPVGLRADDSTGKTWAHFSEFLASLSQEDATPYQPPQETE